MKMRNALVIGLFSLVLTIGLWSYSKASGNTITACVKQDGVMHVIGAGFRRTECKGNETLLSWNIQGPKGDKGDPGEKGDKGDSGLQGPKGADGGVRVKDVDGNDLGLFLGIIDNHEYAGVLRLFIPTLDRWIPLNATTGKYAFHSMNEANAVYFSEQNCLGQAYITTLLGTQSVDRIVNTSALDGSQPLNNRFFKVENPKLGPNPILLHSKLYNAACNNIGDVYSHAATATEIQLPFTLPVSTPLLMRTN